MEYPNAIDLSFTLAHTGSLELVGTVDGLNGRTDTCNVTIANTHASAALTDFSVQVLTFVGGTYLDFLVAANFATQDNNMLFCSSAVPNTLAALTKCLLMIRTGPIHGIRFYAKSGSAVPVTVQGILG